MNNPRLYLLFVSITAMLVIPGWFLAGIYGAAFCVLLSAVILGLLYYRSDSKVMSKFDGRKLNDKSSWVYKLVEDISKKARLDSTPEVYLIPVKAPNSFIVGRTQKRAQLGLTEGLLESLTKGEIEGVVGHELAHIRENGTNVGGIVTGIVSPLWGLVREGRNGSRYRSLRVRDIEYSDDRSFLDSVLSAMITPLAATFVQLGIKRNREFVADRKGATFTNRFSELASALRKIDNSTERIASDNHPQLAHLLIHSNYHKPYLSFFFRVHPPIEERIEQLEKLAVTGGGVEGVY